MNKICMDSKNFYVIIIALLSIILLCIYIIYRNKYSIFDSFEPRSKNYYSALPFIGKSITPPNLFRIEYKNNDESNLTNYQIQNDSYYDINNDNIYYNKEKYEKYDKYPYDFNKRERYDDLERPNPYYPTVGNINMPPLNPNIRQSLLSGFNPNPNINRNPLSSYRTRDRDELEYRNGIMLPQPNNAPYIKRDPSNPSSGFLEIGYVQPNKDYKSELMMQKMMKLYGRNLDNRSNKFDYYILNPFNDIKIPLTGRNNNELNTNDIIKIEGFKGDYIVKLYY